MKRIVLLGALFFALPAAALEEGVYELTGYGGPTLEKPLYRGTVEIRRTGQSWHLDWHIGAKQSQKGVAILTDKVLSVAYFDMSGKDAGVVSYRVDGRTLDGRWTSHGQAALLRELLSWKSALPVPGVAKP